MNSSSNFLSKLNIGRNDFIEIESKPITKIFLSNTTEGYGFLSNAQDLYNTIKIVSMLLLMDFYIVKMYLNYQRNRSFIILS